MQIIYNVQNQRWRFVLILLVLGMFMLSTLAWGGVDEAFTEKTAKAYCQESKNRREVDAKSQNQCCAAATKQCHESCSKKKSGSIACSGGCNAAFESCWDKNEKPKNFNAKWMYSYCQKRHSRVRTHNSCCRSMETNCGAACDHKYPPSQRGSCMNRCENAASSCFRVAKKINKKPFDPSWMKNYCSIPRNYKKIKADNQEDCCQNMYDRCTDACDGYPLNERKACKNRCGEAIDRCR